MAFSFCELVPYPRKISDSKLEADPPWSDQLLAPPQNHVDPVQ